MERVQAPVVYAPYGGGSSSCTGGGTYSDISIIEGVMGYYDGFEGNSNYASTHHVASILNLL